MATKRLIDANALQFEPDESCIANGVLIRGGKSGGKTMTTVLRALKAMIDNAPTVDAVEVVHGRWLNVKETEVYSPDNRCTFTHTAETCSVCDIRSGFIGAKLYLYDNHCPNCGAKMDLKGE